MRRNYFDYFQWLSGQYVKQRNSYIAQNVILYQMASVLRHEKRYIDEFKVLTLLFSRIINKRHSRVISFAVLRKILKSFDKAQISEDEALNIICNTNLPETNMNGINGTLSVFLVVRDLIRRNYRQLYISLTLFDII